MSVLKLLGIALIFSAAILFVREYSAYCKKRRSECLACLKLFEHMRSRLERYLLPMSELCLDFKDATLDALGFFSAAQAGGIPHAFEEIKDKLSVSREFKNRISEFLCNFGKGYLKEESKRLSDMLSEISELCKVECENIETSEKVTKTLVFGLALGIIVLIL